MISFGGGEGGGGKGDGARRGYAWMWTTGVRDVSIDTDGVGSARRADFVRGSLVAEPPGHVILLVVESFELFTLF